MNHADGSVRFERARRSGTPVLSGPQIRRTALRKACGTEVSKRFTAARKMTCGTGALRWKLACGNGATIDMPAWAWSSRSPAAQQAFAIAGSSQPARRSQHAMRACDELLQPAQVESCWPLMAASSAAAATTRTIDMTHCGEGRLPEASRMHELVPNGTRGIVEGLWASVASS